MAFLAPRIFQSYLITGDLDLEETGSSEKIYKSY